MNQVRNELPAESEVPTISVQSADSEFASAYLSFSSDFLSQSEITDYLVRAVQPRLASLTGMQRVEIFGARTFAMRVWLRPERMAALNVSPDQVRSALAANNYLAAVGQTIAALSHHIKNIMQGVRFGGDMVRTALADDDDELLHKGWKLVEKNQARIDDLILDMLSYSKDREPAVEPTALNALVADVLDVVRGRAAGLGVVLDWQPGELPTVPCDPEGIHKALLNVASNAVDAVEGRESPRVEVTTGLTADGRFAEVSVADNGPGIPPERLADVFKPFVSSKGSKGTGLGLPVSRKVLREHGGDVIVESEPGRGCRFVLRIPLRTLSEPEA